MAKLGACAVKVWMSFLSLAGALLLFASVAVAQTPAYSIQAIRIADSPVCGFLEAASAGGATVAEVFSAAPATIDALKGTATIPRTLRGESTTAAKRTLRWSVTAANGALTWAITS